MCVDLEGFSRRGEKCDIVLLGGFGDLHSR